MPTASHVNVFFVSIKFLAGKDFFEKFLPLWIHCCIRGLKFDMGVVFMTVTGILAALIVILA